MANERDFELNSVCEMLKVRLELLKESGLTYIGKSTSDGSKGAGSEELKALESKVRDCQQCGLSQCRTNTVFGVGAVDARIVFVGEAPGENEDLEGEPFVGKAGALLTKMINAMGFERKDVYICNVIKCRPPQNRDPTPEEIQSCEPYLRKQLAILRPEVIVGLGRHACQTLLKTDRPMTKIRGEWSEYDGIKFMPTFHPAYLLRNPPAKKFVWEDLQAVLQALGLKSA